MYLEEIKSAIQKYKNCPLLELKAFKAMAKRHPEGEKSFWVGKRYEYLKAMPEKSAFGWRWINSDCPDLAKKNGFIDIINNNIIDIVNDFGYSDDKRKDEFAKKEIDTFIRLWLEYRAIDAIIADLEQDYSELFGKLSGYIADVNINEFDNIVKHHALSPGTPKATWIGTPADAHRFACQINMKVADWNKCFKGVKDRTDNLRWKKR